MGVLGRRFWLIFTASGVSSLGDGMRGTVLPLLAADVTRDPITVAGLTAAGTAPWVAFGLTAGALADRRDRRLLVAAAYSTQALAVAVLAAAVAGGARPAVLLYAVAFAIGAAETVSDTAAPALVPSLVPLVRLGTANGRLAAARTLAAEFAGPPLGGVLFT